MSTVWTLKARSDLEMQDAKRFGEVKELFDGNINVYNLEEMMSDITVSLRKFNDGDYLMKMGDQCAWWCCLFVLDHVFQFKEVKILIWEARENKYASRVVDFGQMFDIANQAEFMRVASQ